MAGRANAMADINNYLLDQSADQAAQNGPLLDDQATSAPTEAVGAPEIERANKQAVQAQKDQLDIATKQAKLEKLQEEKQERESIRQMQAAQAEADRQREEESQAQQSARAAVQGARDTATRAQERVSQSIKEVGAAIGSVPIPGDIIVPLSILLLFFFALIPINGHTRLSWLWLVLTGNAHLTGENLSAFAAHPPTEPTGTLFPSGTVPPTEPTGTLFPPSGTKTATIIPKPSGGQGQASRTPAKPVGGQGQASRTPAVPQGGQGQAARVVGGTGGLAGLLSTIPFAGVGEP